MSCVGRGQGMRTKDASIRQVVECSEADVHHRGMCSDMGPNTLPFRLMRLRGGKVGGVKARDLWDKVSIILHAELPEL